MRTAALFANQFSIANFSSSFFVKFDVTNEKENTIRNLLDFSVVSLNLVLALPLNGILINCQKKKKHSVP